jgi:hypothetical protein
MIPKRLLLLISLLSCTLFYARGQQAITLSAYPDSTISVKGELASGQHMARLQWAWDSQNACFVSSQQHKFTGHHMLYRAQLPPRAELFIKVIPANKQDNFSLYAYSGAGDYLPPELPYCTSCEADYKWDYKYAGKTQDHTRQVSLRAVNNPLPVTIGVVGAEGLSQGAFTLELRMEGGQKASNNKQEAIPKYQLPAITSVTQYFEGDLKDGVFVHDLSWAWSSQNACFVAPRKNNFTGHHILYLASIPAKAEIAIELQPKAEANMSLYAYSLAGEYEYVPDLPRCISCEASFSYGPYGRSSYKEEEGKRKVSLRAGQRPLKIVIGVAGADQLSEGTFILGITKQ